MTDANFLVLLLDAWSRVKMFLILQPVKCIVTLIVLILVPSFQTDSLSEQYFPCN